jgi:hypothetical protein
MDLLLRFHQSVLEPRHGRGDVGEPEGKERAKSMIGNGASGSVLSKAAFFWGKTHVDGISKRLAGRVVGGRWP